MKKKSKIYAKNKDSKHPAYMKIARKTKSEFQKAKLSFEQKLAKNIKGDTVIFLRMSAEKLSVYYAVIIVTVSA